MASKKKMVRKKRSSTSAHKSAATRTRHDLTKKLKEDLKATREALKSARAAAREELMLTKAAAKAEIAVLKDHLQAAQKREQAIVKLAEQKAKMMWQTSAQWEKKQLAKIQKLFKPKSKITN